MLVGTVKPQWSDERALGRIRLLPWMAALVLIPFSNGGGCSPQPSQTSNPSVTGPHRSRHADSRPVRIDRAVVLGH